MAKRQALGRGLSALLENSSTEHIEHQMESRTLGDVAGPIALMHISHIEANPFQPRTKFNEEALDDLARSIKAYGIIQPLTVRKIGASRYQLISGERRFRASQIAEVEEVPVYIRAANDQEMLELALVENIQRENLDPIEVAISYKRLIEECRLTQDQLSHKVGKSRSSVTNFLRLLKLPAEVQISLIEKKISMGHARALINTGSEAFQIKLCKQIIKDDLSVRQVEDLVRAGKTDSPAPRKSKLPLSLEQQKMLADLRLKYGKNAGLKIDQMGGGTIQFKFSSEDDLQRLLDLLDS
jgi:ParB family chromosome partitioning protein